VNSKNSQREYLKPSEIAAARGIKVGFVHGWIRSGELEAIDCRSVGASRPAWKISPQALADFENRRSCRANVKPKPSPRRRVAAKPSRQWV